MLQMETIETRLLTDDELRPQLEAKEMIVFSGRETKWREIERQVERLGYGNLYIVSVTDGTATKGSRIILRPK